MPTALSLVSICLPGIWAVLHNIFNSLDDGVLLPNRSLNKLLNDYGVLKFFESWKNSILDEEVGEVAYKVDYQRDIKIHQLKRPISNKELSLGSISIDFSQNFVYSVVLENAFPSTIQNVELTNDLEAIGEITVQIDYSNVKPIRSPFGNITIDTPFGILGTSIGL